MTDSLGAFVALDSSRQIVVNGRQSTPQMRLIWKRKELLIYINLGAVSLGKGKMSILVRWDQENAEKENWSFVDELIAPPDTMAFFRSLMRSHRLLVEVPLPGAGTPVLEFEVSGLKTAIGAFLDLTALATPPTSAPVNGKIK